MDVYKPTQGFNTASGKYYCNLKLGDTDYLYLLVSIPQAVSTIAMSNVKVNANEVVMAAGFNTASGKYYCNILLLMQTKEAMWFQYRKR